ncbi:hypothetical protein LJC51_07465 [Lachnospiraceae bacterium OttesenSCG-928-J05]|nr:hypothetical protein [Lachnospiraceae bacterium OttesenSCG-928-J05]
MNNKIKYALIFMSVSIRMIIQGKKPSKSNMILFLYEENTHNKMKLSSVQNPWTLSDDELPPKPKTEDLESYIVMIEGAKKPTSLVYEGDDKWTDNEDNYYPVIAWMRFPAFDEV